MMITLGEFSIIEMTSYMGLAVTSVSVGYLQPQVIQKDERMKHIRQKAMQYSLMAMLVYMFLLMFLLQLQLVGLTSFETIALIANSTIIMFG
ncbi:hypothetical protein CEY16_10485 [Halalkalibacillus sediminis]|uniref:Uncharacterized protein n=1 Tax=Halalkalibacillus sediminis TaxID=2018042 RepID=A0A2I0QS41_9BACI|nr:hypothetical protein [Halalkalibacillus sediminis]PKR77162.1 hypothetical protein CEY16_10485 [Halalkalibacillus sediminis]